MTTLRLETPRVFKPLLEASRYKAAYGGRGSGKSHFFAEKLIEDHLLEPGMRSVCIREVQKSLKESSKRLIEDKLQSLNLGEADGFKVFQEVIQAPGDGLITFQGMQDHTAESIKSLEGYKRAWVEEAQGLSARSLSLLRPTIRADASELWFSWNPRKKSDPVDLLFRGSGLPTGATVVRANWSDNPFFPAVLEAERLDCLRLTPEQYEHIWEGGYATVLEGAYFAACLADAKRENRIGKVGADPLMATRLFVDIGGTGAKADAFAMWVCQFVGREIRVLNYYEAIGQPIGAHLAWLREQNLGPGKAQFWLPHDGDSNDKVIDVSYASALRAAGYTVEVVPNQGKGAAKARIEAVRRRFPLIHFNEATTTPGREALGWYHEKKDDARNVGLGPEHDWACFAPETKVLTRQGMCQISALPNQGEILTPCGWKRYINPRVTGRNAPLVEVAFSDGSTVKCTPEHLFLTVNGWKSAEHLERGSLIQSSLTRSRSISMAVYTVCGQAKRTFHAVAKSFIGLFGNAPSARFLTGATLTILTETRKTTCFQTFNASLPASTYQKSARTKKELALPNLLWKKLGTGTSLRKGGCGIEGTQSERNLGLNGRGLKSLAHTAAKQCRRLLEKVATHRNTALVYAKPLRIERVNRLTDRSDVWCLTVPDGALFSLWNGAVVHNSHGADAFGLMCVVYQEPRSVAPLDYSKLNKGIV